MTDNERIDALGGPAKLAELLGYVKAGGVQRVHNWRVRGIPASVKVSRPDLFMTELAAGSLGAARAQQAPGAVNQQAA